jgi:hypothetical protein
MKHPIWLAAAVAFVLGTAIACGSSDDSRKSMPTPASATQTTAASPATTGAGTFTLIGFADHAAQNNFAPADVTASGGTIRSCNPPHLYAFLNFSNLTPPKQFAGSWTLNGAALNTQTFTQTSASATSFFEVQNTPQPLVAGAYSFQLAVDGVAVTRGSFTLVC